MDILKQFKALSDPTRLRLAHILDHFELNVNEIVSIVDMIQSGVSRHLKILLEAGLVASRKEGSYIYYSAKNTKQSQDLVSLVRARVENDSVFRGDISRAEQCILLRKSRAKRFFRTVAPQWDRLKKEVLGEFDLNSLFIENVMNQNIIADLGCGTGELLEHFLGQSNAPLIGVDASPEMLEQARIKLPERSCLELRLGELENLPMRDQEVDTAVMSMVLHHIFEPEKSIQEVFRVLKPGGIFLLADFLRHDQEEIQKIIGGTWLGFTRKQIQNWLLSCGFTLKSDSLFPVEKNLSITFYLAQK
ncbi:MAG: metalloregulator ArsR/SmtB family transcription factor [Desulfobacter sp.]|nr:metalloregulator ArsR/SmtB family transcription factor [Desulfobacter sp.]WDP86571.1 MAG: metalloregulator ArsR/SmtB family transcription factor [Desulfobacter sp.]